MCGCSQNNTGATVDSGDLIAVIHPSPPQAPSSSPSVSLSSSPEQEPAWPYPMPTVFDQVPTFAGKLRLSNKTPGGMTKSFLEPTYPIEEGGSGEDVSSRGASTVRNVQARNVYVRIHKFGQAIPYSTLPFVDTTADGNALENPVMHSFLASPDQRFSSTGFQLNLGVGGDGVVGRTVSIVDARESKILGQGIIGFG